ncbi:glycine betaine ABC transporter substrate-binding protein [Desulfobulbus oligotrophicus]|uniref:Glycine betaine ABC transporter substrate-binding protein n=1 Tax=Desulfobulbus oligotrophicus TaxID=1909699 RepID=A0A7T6API8_9BACT|nr:glycine betaine ABC transporter substrate-binding protein [Desulfobulbus oligotrophicus]QQG64746.1 glycine betaine ABC transporter substrate-binding protein [Desulfobulbus oligotrophicus]
MKKIFLVLAGLLLLMAQPVLAAKGKVRMAYVEWDCALASTMVAKAALEQMGYEVETLPVAAAAMWQALGTGNVDASVAAWLPNTHADYLARLQDKVERVSIVTGGAKLGWAVPSYVTISSIEELNAHADRFNNEIIGIDPGAGLMRLSEQAIADYGLQLELVDGSGATMTAALANALKNKQWIVVTGWTPHWMFGKWDLKYLDDPKGVLGGEEQIETVVRQGLKTDMPEVYTFFSNFGWDSAEQLQMVMAWNQEGGTPEENAHRFLKEHPETVNRWMSR